MWRPELSPLYQQSLQTRYCYNTMRIDNPFNTKQGGGGMAQGMVFLADLQNSFSQIPRKSDNLP